MKGWRTISSKLVYNKRRVRILEDVVELPDGQQTEYVVLQGGEAVAVLPLTPEGQAVLVKQYRYPIRQTTLELPGGGGMRGESVEESAGRELQEETGYKAGRLTYLGNFYPSPARSSARVHVYVADQLQPVPTTRQLDEFIELELIDWERLVALVVQNEIKDPTLTWAVLMWQARRGVGG